MQKQKLTLSAEASEILQTMNKTLREKILATGKGISFEDFMQTALYEPNIGYYQNRLEVFGEQGDFITAPEMGDLFARSIANAIISMPVERTEQILELGAGTGALAADLLFFLSKTDRAPKQYYILEPSAGLQTLQKEKLESVVPELVEKVIWLNSLPTNFDGIIFGNEVVDAIPCHRIKKVAGHWVELNVGLKEQEEEFVWLDGEPLETQGFPEPLKQIDNFVEGYETEIRSLSGPWIKGISQSLARGLILLFDYGYPEVEYFHPQRTDGTLRCFSRHIAHSNPLALAGLQDITAHVDFTELARKAVSHGLEVLGFTSQAGFLLENKILEVEADTNEQQRFSHSQQIQKLTAPGQMGEVMKVIALAKKCEEVPSGFQLQDQLHRL